MQNRPVLPCGILVRLKPSRARGTLYQEAGWPDPFCCIEVSALMYKVANCLDKQSDCRGVSFKRYVELLCICRLLSNGESGSSIAVDFCAYVRLRGNSESLSSYLSLRCISLTGLCTSPTNKSCSRSSVRTRILPGSKSRCHSSQFSIIESHFGCLW